MSGKAWSTSIWSYWNTSIPLRLCSMSAQGLWMHMLCLAARADPVGYVTINGEPPGNAHLARLTGATEPEISAWLAELEKWGVSSRDSQGRIYCSWMLVEGIVASLRGLGRIVVAEDVLGRDGHISWSKVRRLIRERDGDKCRYCGCSVGPFEIDHVVPRCAGGSNHPGNLVVACTSCNRSKGGKSLEEWRP